MTQPATTFALLHQHDACNSGYRKLAKHLGGVIKYGRNKPIPLLTILDNNGLDDALWSLRATVEPWKQEAAFMGDCIGHVRRARVKYSTHHLSAWEVANRVADVVFSHALFDIGDSTYKAERAWQAKRLRQYLTGTARKIKRTA